MFNDKLIFAEIAIRFLVEDTLTWAELGSKNDSFWIRYLDGMYKSLKLLIMINKGRNNPDFRETQPYWNIFGSVLHEESHSISFLESQR